MMGCEGRMGITERRAQVRGRLLLGLLVAALAVAIIWFVIEPVPESLIAALTALIALLSIGTLREARAGRETAPPALEGRKRLAVLPLRSIAAAPGREYFAAGLTEELISVLSRVRNLELIASSSSAGYQEGSPSISRIGRELKVGAVLHGSVRSVEDDLRVSIRLVDASSERLLWSEDYDRKLEAVFSVQRDIAVSVAAALQVTVPRSEVARIGDRPTEDLEAYDLYLLARHELNKRTEHGLLRSIEHFRSALARDPSFAAAHAGIADAYVLATIGYAPIPKDTAAREARAAVDRALQIQETLADAHTSLGWILMNFDRDWAASKAAFERALELNPSDSRAYQWLAQCHSYQGRPEEAIDYARRAMELDPRSPLIVTEAGWPYVYLGRWDEAEVLFRRALELDPGFALAHFNLGSVLEARGDWTGALAKYQEAASLSGDAPMYVAFVARAQGLLGRPDEARASLRRVIAGAEAGAPLSIYIAHAYEGLGETEEALDWLERALADDDPLILAVGSTWLPFDRLRGSPRYAEIRRRVPKGTLARPASD